MKIFFSIVAVVLLSGCIFNGTPEVCDVITESVDAPVKLTESGQLCVVGEKSNTTKTFYIYCKTLYEEASLVLHSEDQTQTTEDFKTRKGLFSSCTAEEVNS